MSELLREPFVYHRPGAQKIDRTPSQRADKMYLLTRAASPQAPAAACPRSLRAPCSCALTGRWVKGKRVGGGAVGVDAQPFPPALSAE
eukprot:CAMPEP_0173372260 /NCGR_PEP_ID=MMETSP1144-20121109/27772_1 /TAXON_ID=483371 /ORGANISM="non described non described, Strain CCMP2298" /LENGTH=87 /DNA_ID=CAMNT_0014324161 /DNA_START=1 /DNA_END=261 /DNA_ORIENTATION=+